MLYVDKNNVIRLTRGDTARFIVTVKNETTQEPYDILPRAEGAVANAPWGATNAKINYNYTGG